MDNYKNSTICNFLRKWLREARITQTALARKLGVSQSLLSRQLLGKENIPLYRIEDIIAVVNPNPEEYAQVIKLMSIEYGKNRKLDEMHKWIDEIGVDDLLYSLLSVWSDISLEEKKSILAKLASEVQQRKQNREDSEAAMAPEVIQTMAWVASQPLETRKKFFALIDHIMKPPLPDNASEEQKEIMREEEATIQKYGIKKLMEEFGMLPNGVPESK